MAKTPAVAKKLGKTTEIASRKDWPAYKDTVMKKALAEKFSANHPELRKKLLETGNALLRDGSPMDNYWGIGRSKKGRNRLGQLLMEVRDELRRAETAAAAAATRAAIGGGAAGASGLGIDALLTRPSVDAANAAAAATGGAAPAVVIQMGGEAVQQPVVAQVQQQPAPIQVPVVEEESAVEAPAPDPAPINPNPPQMKILDLTAATAQPLPAAEVAPEPAPEPAPAPAPAPEFKTVYFKPVEPAKN